MNMRNTALSLLTVSTVFSSVFAVSEDFPNPLMDAKVYATAICAIATMALGVWSLLFQEKKKSWASFVFVMEGTVTTVCTAQAVFFLLQKLCIVGNYGELTAGSFDNVAGLASCLCLSLPMGWRWKDKLATPWRMVLLIAKVLCILAIICSGSRTGVICVITLLLLIVSPVSIRKWLVGAVLSLAFVLALYVKTDSTRGRWFILQRASELVWQHPLTGWGRGGVAAHYMDVQADYFSRHPQSEYSILADNVRHPLNELMAFAIDWGLPALVIMLAFFGFICHKAWKEKSSLSLSCLLLLGITGLFCMFSYPFHYPFTWLMLIFTLGCIYRHEQARWHRLAGFSLLVVIPVGGYYCVSQCLAQQSLAGILKKTVYGLDRKMLPRYKQLYPKLKTDYRYLFYYASSLYESGLYREALDKEKECHQLLADYDLCLLTADTFREMGRKNAALWYYHRAHLMCPARLLPLYEQYCIHRDEGDTVACRQLRKEILGMRIKVKSETTEQILQDVSGGMPHPNSIKNSKSND